MVLQYPALLPLHLLSPMSGMSFPQLFLGLASSHHPRSAYQKNLPCHSAKAAFSSPSHSDLLHGPIEMTFFAF